jgi:hypothetical protein
MTEQEKVNNAHILDGLTIHNIPDSNGEIIVLLDASKEGQPAITISTTFKILESAVAAIKEELEKSEEK